MAAKRGLGRGLKSLMQDQVTPENPAETSGQKTGDSVAISLIDANQFQPRKTFEPEALADLVSSIRERGVLQPVLLRKAGDRYELIAGERRLRASTEAGLVEIPARVLDVDDTAALELALVENIQREDLNVVEEAEGYQLLMDKFGLTQATTAKRVGKSRAAVANALRLLSLPDNARGLLASGELSAGHAKVLCGLDNPQEVSRLAKKVVSEGLSVRGLERLLADTPRPMKKSRKKRDDIPGTHLTFLTETIQRYLGTGVHLSSCKTLPDGKQRKGKLEIEYYSSDDLTRILEVIGMPDLD